MRDLGWAWFSSSHSLFPCSLVSDKGVERRIKAHEPVCKNALSNAIDALRTGCVDLIEDIIKDPSCSKWKMEEPMIVKYFECIDYHAQKISEWVIFAVMSKHKNKQIL